MSQPGGFCYSLSTRRGDVRPENQAVSESQFHGQSGAEFERINYLEFIARVTSHIPDKDQVMFGGRMSVLAFLTAFSAVRITPPPAEAPARWHLGH